MDRILKYAFLVLGLAIIVISFYLSSRPIPFLISDLLPRDHPVRLQYLKDQDLFGDEHSFYIVIHRRDGQAFGATEIYPILRNTYLSLKMTDAVESVTSLENAEYLMADGKKVRFVPFLQTYGSAFGPRELKELEKDFWKNRFVDQDGKHLLVTGNLFKFIENVGKRTHLQRLTHVEEEMEAKYSHLDFHFLGTKVGQYHLFLETLRNQKIITPLLFVLLSLLIYFLYRSLPIVAWFFSAMMLAHAFCILFIVGVDGGISAHGGFAIFFVLIIATSDLIHFFSIYCSQDTPNIRQRIEVTKKEIYLPCFLTSLTTVVAFSSLMLSPMVPIAQIGLYCAAGSVFCFLITFYLLPYFLVQFQVTHKGEITHWGDRLFPLFKRALDCPLRTIATFAILTALLVAGTTQLKIDDRFYDKFKESHPINKALKTFSDTFSLVGSIGLIFDLKENQFDSPEVLTALEKFENEVGSLQKVAYIKSLRQFHHYTNEVFAKTSQSKELQLKSAESFLTLLKSKGLLSGFFHKESNTLRTEVFLKESSSATTMAIVNDIKQIAESPSYARYFSVRPNGFVVLRSFIAENVIKGMLNSLGASLFIIFVIFVLTFKSTVWALLALIPNLLPLITIGGLIGWLDEPLESSLVLLVCITIGIAVDDTIHFLVAYKRQLVKFKDQRRAAEEAFLKTSKALIGTTFVFVLSFPCFFLADLKTFNQVGMFVMLSLVVALVSDLLLLPAIFNLLKKPAEEL